MDIKKLKAERLAIAFDLLANGQEKESQDLFYWHLSTRDDGFAYIKIPHVKESDIVIGAKFWYDNSSMKSTNDIRLMTVTYVRGDVAFYIDDKDQTERNFFTSGTLFADRIIEYAEYTTDYNSDLFKFVSIYGFTIINYLN